MGNGFCADRLNQSLLFPPSLHDWLSDNHLDRFVAAVVSALDLSAIYKSYQDRMARALIADGWPPLRHFVD
jgi:hypothetical protein